MYVCVCVPYKNKICVCWSKPPRAYILDVVSFLLTWSQVNVIISFNIEIRIEQRIGSLKEC